MLKYDLVVVGTSFASTFFLKKYLEKNTEKVRILVLERGNYYSHSDRLQHVIKKPYGLRYLDGIEYKGKTYHTNKPEKPWIFEPNFGGSSNCWTGCTPRFMPNDFKLKSLYNRGQDWPISYDDLEPYYCETEAIMGISGPTDTPYPMSKPYPLPPHSLSNVDKLIQQRYGKQYIAQPSARASIPVGKRNTCCNNSICHLCPMEAKFTIANTLKYVYDDPRVELEYDAQVVGLICTSTHAQNIEYIKNNKRITVAAEVVALGANAIFNAHILLNSGDSNYYTGRGICEQLGYFAYLYLDGMDNLGGSTMITANGFMLYDGDHRKDYAACIIESLQNPYVRSDFKRWRQIARFKFVFEDLPQDSNQVLLSKNELKPMIKYEKYSDYAIEGYRALSNKIEKLFDFLPIEKLILDERPQDTEAHILSTTRMGHSQENSVIDKNLIHHQYRNVFVLGGGAFPTISAANPTLTLSALSLLAADKNF